MNETGTAARALINPTETEQGSVTQIRRPLFRLISGLENTASAGGWCGQPGRPPARGTESRTGPGESPVLAQRAGACLSRLSGLYGSSG